MTLACEDGDEDYVANSYTPNELAFNKSEFFKVEKLLGIWGWGRWSLIKQKTDMSLSENDMEHISRCHYFFWFYNFFKLFVQFNVYIIEHYCCIAFVNFVVMIKHAILFGI